MNRIKTIQNPLGYKITYQYDLVGNKLSETNELNHTMTYTYDKLNRLERTIDPYGVVISKKVYGANGNVIKEIDAKGYLSGSTDNDRYGIEYKYDLANRWTEIAHPQMYQFNNYMLKSEVTYEYNQYSQKIKTTDGEGNVTKYEYDNGPKLVAVIDALGDYTRYSYDQAGNKLTITNGNGQTTKYIYGECGLLIEVRDADNNLITY
ncbi:RHS repeat protein [Inediibacterium massiliense]|uniref:RHS repeat protein n=1 Tax=Inediibacterium massiliense TaxID=1658111 RepID=UPI0006B59142|nr:RHS repeat protein [Inediibacterium massiliense]